MHRICDNQVSARYDYYIMFAIITFFFLIDSATEERFFLIK